MAGGRHFPIIEGWLCWEKPHLGLKVSSGCCGWNEAELTRVCVCVCNEKPECHKWGLESNPHAQLGKAHAATKTQHSQKNKK